MSFDNGGHIKAAKAAAERIDRERLSKADDLHVIDGTVSELRTQLTELKTTLRRERRRAAQALDLAEQIADHAPAALAPRLKQSVRDLRGHPAPEERPNLVAVPTPMDEMLDSLVGNLHAAARQQLSWSPAQLTHIMHGLALVLADTRRRQR